MPFPLTLSLLLAAATHSHAPTTSSQKIAPAAPHETTIYVGDMHCAACAKKVSGRLFKVKGVMRVRTDVAADLAIVTPQTKKEIDPLAAWEAVRKAGFPALRLVGPQGELIAEKETGKPIRVARKPAESVR